MYTRYDVRNACFRILKGAEPKHPELKEIIAEKIKGQYNWTSFGKEWDVVVLKGEITVVAAIKDVNEVLEVCTKRQMVAELGVEKEWNEREQHVIEAIEAQFLDGIMTWENYKTAWTVVKDEDRDTVVTKLLKVDPGQKPVTQEDIDRKLKEQMQQSKRTAEEARKAINVHDSEVTLEANPLASLTPEQQAAIMAAIGKQ